MFKKSLVILLAASLAVASFTGCGHKKTTTDASTKETLGAPGESGAVPDSLIDWPDRGEEMSPIITALVCANQDNPDLKYDFSDSKSFWTYMYYVLCASGTTGGFAEAVDGQENTYTIKSALLKVFARTIFASYDGTGSFPELPSDYKDITYDKDSDTYTYKIRDDKSSTESSVYSCGEVDKATSTYATVSFYMDENSKFYPWKVFMVPTTGSDSPLFPYSISGIEKVEEDVTTAQEQES